MSLLGYLVFLLEGLVLLRLILVSFEGKSVL